MQNEEKKTISNDTIAQADAVTDSSSPTRSYSPARDAKPSSLSARSPAESSVSSDLSHRTSLSHGSSPGEEKRPASPPGNVPAPQPVVNRSVWEEPVAVTKVDPGVGDGSFSGVVEGGGGGGGVRRVRQSLSILRRAKRETMVKKAALGFRVCGLVFCLISFSVMAADKNKGWAIDSFYRYKEFRYCMTVNVIGFVYSVAQAYDLAYHLSTGKYFVRHQLRYYVDFSLDQTTKGGESHSWRLKISSPNANLQMWQAVGILHLWASGWLVVIFTRNNAMYSHLAGRWPEWRSERRKRTLGVLIWKIPQRTTTEYTFSSI